MDRATALVVNSGLTHQDRVGETEVEWILPPQFQRRVEEVFTSGR